MEKQVRECFARTFGEEGNFVCVRAPGRVNLIGEHTDYQGGYVFPIAVDRFIYCCGRRRSDEQVRIHSMTYGHLFETHSRAQLTRREDMLWVNYVLGVMREFQRGRELPGFDLAVGGDVPVASGLSSSAALEIAAAVFLTTLLEVDMPPLEIIKLARRAENEFVGVNCGIMDQFSSYLCRKEHALLLNCDTLEYEHVPMRTGAYSFLLVDTLRERSLASSTYNRRVREVTEALDGIRRLHPDVRSLGEVNTSQLSVLQDAMAPVPMARAQHVVTENERVLKAVSCLQDGDMRRFGSLLYESHESLREKYEVSCEELDFIVDFAQSSAGVAGARLTGAGFGGCCLVLIRGDAIARFEKDLAPEYERTFRRRPRFYEVHSADGAFYEGGNHG